MVVAKPMKKCPACREPIAADATRCKHCQTDLGDKRPSAGGIYARWDNFRVGFFSGVLFALIILILLWGQFNWSD